MTCDDAFFSHLQDGPYTSHLWEKIANHIFHKLGEYLGDSIVVSSVEYELERDEQGFSADFSSSQEPMSPLALKYLGFLQTAATCTEHNTLESPFVAAWLIVLSQNKRLVTNDGNSYMYLVYNRSNCGKSAWRNEGWQSDEYGEFEHWGLTG